MNATSMIPNDQKIPTRYPPINKAEIEVPPATSEYMIKAVVGGMIIPVGADAMLTAVANFRSYPSSTC